MADESLKIVQFHHFPDEAMECFSKLARDPDQEMDQLQRMVNEREAGLFLIGECWAVIKLAERINGESDFVVCAVQGKDLAGIGHTLIEWARKAGCSRIRYHTSRKGHERLVKDFNPKFLEYVYTVDV